MPVSASSGQNLSLHQRHGRAANAVATLFRKMLRMPNIYLEIGWPTLGGKRLDLMAIDEAGSGDIHVAEIKLGFTDTKDSALQTMKATPSHFMYLASDTSALADLADDTSRLFARNGIGKIGLIGIEEREGSEPLARLITPGERFRMPEEKYKDVKRYLSKHQPDIEIRI